MKMDEQNRNAIMIDTIYPNDEKEFDILYIKCKNSDSAGNNHCTHQKPTSHR